MIKVDELVGGIIRELDSAIEVLLDKTFRETFGISLTSRNAPQVEHEIWHEERKRHVYKYKGTTFLILIEGSPTWKHQAEIGTLTIRWKIETPTAAVVPAHQS